MDRRNERLLHENRRRVEERHGSRANPSFSFVADVLASDPYAGLVRDLAARFACNEDTDPNDDVGFGYGPSDASGRWIVRLSMVGPCAVLLRGRRDGSLMLVSMDTRDGNETERWLRSRPTEAGRVLVDRDRPRAPVDLALGHAEPGAVNVWRASFTDSDVLPWEVAA